MWAIKNGLDKTVQRLVPKMSISYINIKDCHGNTALMYAIKAKNEVVANQLLNREGIVVNSIDVFSFTCLMWASKNGLDQTVQRLLPKLSITDINKKDSIGTTALMHAIKEKHETVANQLLNLEGIDVDSADKDGKTCSMRASENLIKLFNDSYQS